eukprot:c40988_g1_i1.p1 GENE.c40988_g1_i1~~c40988_g1_i1.p1  ORF type:complete len:266 (-),score=42.08 c40988_g1_i1:104-901(-)
MGDKPSKPAPNPSWSNTTQERVDTQPRSPPPLTTQATHPQQPTPPDPPTDSSTGPNNPSQESQLHKPSGERHEIGIITVNNFESIERRDDRIDQLLEALPTFESLLVSHITEPLPTWDTLPLAATVDKIQNFNRIWSRKIVSRQRILAQEMVATEALAVKAHTALASTHSDFKNSQSQLSGISKMTQQVASVEESIQEALLILRGLEGALDKYQASKEHAKQKPQEETPSITALSVATTTPEVTTPPPEAITELSETADDKQEKS